MTRCSGALLLTAYFLFSCGCAPREVLLTDEDTQSIKLLYEHVISGAGDLDSLQRQLIEDGVYSFAHFLIEKNRSSFRRVVARSRNDENIPRAITEAYGTDFVRLGAEFYSWADRKASKHKQTGEPSQYQMIESDHFLLYHPHAFSQNVIAQIIREMEHVFVRMRDVLSLDSARLANFGRLAMPKAWQTMNFKDQRAPHVLTGGKIVVILTETQDEMIDIAGYSSHARIGGVTVYSPLLSPDAQSTWMTCHIVLNYSTALSLITLTHEIAHAISMTAYAQPSILDSAVAAGEVSDIAELPIEVIRRSVFRPAGVTAEGLAYWANWEVGTFAEPALLPSARQLVWMRMKKLPPLVELLEGRVSPSLWDRIRYLLLRKPPVKKITDFFVTSAAFIGYLLFISDPVQLEQVFSGGSDVLSPEEIESIYGKPFDQFEAEWHHYMAEVR